MHTHSVLIEMLSVLPCIDWAPVLKRSHPRRKANQAKMTCKFFVAHKLWNLSVRWRSCNKKQNQVKKATHTHTQLSVIHTWSSCKLPCTTCMQPTFSFLDLCPPWKNLIVCWTWWSRAVCAVLIVCGLAPGVCKKQKQKTKTEKGVSCSENTHKSGWLLVVFSKVFASFKSICIEFRILVCHLNLQTLDRISLCTRRTVDWRMQTLDTKNMTYWICMCQWYYCKLSQVHTRMLSATGISSAQSYSFLKASLVEVIGNEMTWISIPIGEEISGS